MIKEQKIKRLMKALQKMIKKQQETEPDFFSVFQVAPNVAIRKQFSASLDVTMI